MLRIPEVAALRSSRGTVRIPPELDVPITPRVQQLIDTRAFRRLARISQLGLVQLVYPGAQHSRFEHSLDAEQFLVAALLHDVGHWPFCHPLEDIALPDLPSHEQFAERFLLGDEMATVLVDQWQLEPAAVAAMLAAASHRPAERILQSLLSGPIDVDKMDYLFRDSLHAGVPYGKNFDQARLIHSLCLDEHGVGVAISDKGKTAAEMMVFARYVMFSEVYWQHAVRAATAMLQRAFGIVYRALDLEALFQLTEQPFVEALLAAAGDGPARGLLEGIFGSRRQLYKRVAQFSLFQQPEVYRLLARQPYPWLVRCAENLAELASSQLGEEISPTELLFDAPPQKLEVEFQIDVHFVKEDRYRRLGAISPVVKTLANEQFDDYVKRVRIFAHPRLAPRLQRVADWSELVAAAVERTVGDGR